MSTQIKVKNPCQRLGAILLEEDVISKGQLREALEKKEAEGGFLGKVLVEMGYINEIELTSILVKQCKIPHISLMDYEVDKSLIEMVTKEVCDAHALVPIDKMGTILTVAMVDPLDLQALEVVRKHCPDLKIKPILCSWNHYENVMRKHFPREVAQEETVSLGSFGLSESTPAKPEAAKKEKPASERETVPAASPEPKLVPDESSPDAQDFRDSLREYVHTIVHSGLEGVGDRVSAHIAKSATLPFTGAQLIDEVRTAMGDALDDALGGLLFQVQEALEHANVPAKELTSAQLSDMLRSNLRLAFEEASSGFLERLEQFIPRDPNNE